jgi:hypothetical protein
VKTGCNLAESSKEGYGSKWAALPMMMVIVLLVVFPSQKNHLGVARQI